MTARERLEILLRRDEILAETRAERLTEEAAAVLGLPAGETLVGVKQTSLAVAKLRAEGKPPDDEEAFTEALAAVGPQPDDVTTLPAPAKEAEPSEGDELVALARSRLRDRGVFEPTYEQLAETLEDLTRGEAA